MNSVACKQSHKVTLVNADWTWNKTYQDLYQKEKTVFKGDVYMKFYDVARLLYLLTKASRIGPGAGFLQIRHGMNCGSDEIPDNVIL